FAQFATLNPHSATVDISLIYVSPKEKLRANLASTCRTQLGGPHSRAMTPIFFNQTKTRTDQIPHPELVEG
ncbi:MAG TPA: hypothetical protein VHZ29_01235, partial [Rhizomicrobium sp.]|nr:hypothetical protein [Rhizomicrobium sp.]